MQPSSGLLPLLDKAANKASFEKGGGLELVCTIHNNFTPEIGIQSKNHPIEKEYHLNQPFIFWVPNSSKFSMEGIIHIVVLLFSLVTLIGSRPRPLVEHLHIRMPCGARRDIGDPQVASEGKMKLNKVRTRKVRQWPKPKLYRGLYYQLDRACNKQLVKQEFFENR